MSRPNRGGTAFLLLLGAALLIYLLGIVVGWTTKDALWP